MRRSPCILASCTGLLALAAVARPAAADPIPAVEIFRCGETLDLPGTYVLIQDIGPCERDGIVIAAPDVRLELAGHTISGRVAVDAPGCGSADDQQLGVSILEAASNARVSGGAVSGFTTGVLSNGPASRLTALRLHDNCAGNAILQGDGSSISRSDLRNGQGGVYVCADDVAVVANQASGHREHGIFVACGDRSRIEQNIADRNGPATLSTPGFGAGIEANAGRGHVIQENALLDNFFGIILFRAVESVVRQNDADGNVVAGILAVIDARDNSIVENTARGNLVDALDESDCPVNRWTDNDFGTESGCID